jgi:hypothetical protein
VLQIDLLRCGAVTKHQAVSLHEYTSNTLIITGGKHDLTAQPGIY